MKALERVAPKQKNNNTVVRKLNPIPVPFSVRGLVAVFACPVLLGLDIFSGSHTMIGTIFLLLLTLLGNERRTLIALFAAVASISLLASVAVIYAHDGNELALTDKFVALILLPLFTYALIRRKQIKVITRKHVPVIDVKIVNPVQERVAMNGESKSVFRHIRRNDNPIDEYTRELIWFVYNKSPKN